MKRFWEKTKSRRSSSSDSGPEYAQDSPEAILLREMAIFCEASGGPQNTQGNEFVHLPKIVEAAESSPSAAKEAAHRIRKYLSTPHSTPNHVQYNAIMLMRILADNPGHSFTRNLDSKFAAVIKDLLRYGRDWHVQHYLREYLSSLETNRHNDQDLQPLLQMWAKEKTKGNGSFVRRFDYLHVARADLESNTRGRQVDRWPMASAQPQGPANSYAPQMHQPGQPPARTLPEPGEMAARIEEARNSAKLLTQFVQTTPQAEMEENDLIKEFVDRCRTSSRLIQTYIHSTNPAPDEDTLLTLIEVNDEISVAVSQQQRAMLRARKARGSATPNSSNVNSPSPPASVAAQSGTTRPVPTEAPRLPEQQSTPPIELPSTVMSGGRPNAPRANSERYDYNSADFEVQNPFADDYATNDSDAERQRQSAATNAPSGSHPTTQPKDQER